jgi:ABC-type protease/lipase transport system fused ATPase/permease subunit
MDTIQIPLYIVVYVVLPTVIGLVTFVGRNILTRIAKLEDQMHSTLSEIETRQIISDKYDPIIQDIKEIKELQVRQDLKLDKIVEMVIQSLKDK